jgi:hypothetical protein
MDISFKEIHTLSEKQKWMRRFFNSYSGEVRNENEKMYANGVRFVLALSGNKELGFARVNDKSNYFTGFTNEPVWNLTDAYIKPAYRGNGVLRQLIMHVIDNYNVKMLLMDADRFEENLLYYEILGFTEYYTVRDGTMVWAFLTEFYPTVEKRNSQEN